MVRIRLGKAQLSPSYRAKNGVPYSISIGPETGENHMMKMTSQDLLEVIREAGNFQF
jgi:hypothetical protein